MAVCVEHELQQAHFLQQLVSFRRESMSVHVSLAFLPRFVAPFQRHRLLALLEDRRLNGRGGGGGGGSADHGGTKVDKKA